ncbi:UDP-glucose/GDP-mannose dehydrogenase family protein [Limnohabitans sp. Rim8]|uniref:UDP-glucose dehydrogenase family protein n=1 Tax=Limnohabitans sp. Rim8 TaxID=1100718 RepID=UPI00260569EE|nr:UDP-glucose/GDP-mannose dehydrogenase family protein [Limnohabitans sp. Rim8]
MKITVVGAGYVGLVTGACLAELGNQVLCVDNNPEKITLLNAAGIPIFEPGLKEMVARNRAEGRIHFTTEMAQAVDHGDVIFIAVGTPSQEDGSADLQHVLAVAGQIGRHLKNFKVVVNKSTVPVGTAYRVHDAIHKELEKRGIQDNLFEVISNPEFLKEGAAIDDFMRPDRIVIGLDSGENYGVAHQKIEQLYASFNRHHARTLWMDVRSAELTKYAANAMLATRISFMNEIANLSDLLGADVDCVRRGIGADQRIGHGFLYAGTGYGGSCFPKDTRALIQTALDYGSQMKVVSAVEQVNDAQKNVLLHRTLQYFGNDLTGLKFAIWGLAFKPNTDDMREAPSRVIIKNLLLRGAHVNAFDPVASHEASQALSLDLHDHPEALSRLQIVESAMQATEQAHALLIVTEWKTFHHPDFAALKTHMQRPLILDGRNIYDPQLLENMGFAYQGIGRRNGLALHMLDEESSDQNMRLETVA